MRPRALALLLTLLAAFAAGSNELPQAPTPQILPAPFDFRQGRDWPKYLHGTKPVSPQPGTRVLLQPEPKQLRADAGTCFTMRVIPARPDVDQAMVKKVPDNVDPKMVIQAPPPCDQNQAAAPAVELRRPKR